MLAACFIYAAKNAVQRQGGERAKGYPIVLELGNRDSGDQLNWTTAFLREESVAECIV